jgi:hypothetical protein
VVYRRVAALVTHAVVEDEASDFAGAAVDSGSKSEPLVESAHAFLGSSSTPTSGAGAIKPTANAVRRLARRQTESQSYR